MNIADQWLYAKKIDNYEIDPVAGLKVLWTSTIAFKATVPAGKRWIFLGGIVDRNVSSTLTGHIRSKADKYLRTLIEETAATGEKFYPEYVYGWPTPIIMDAGDYIHLHFGTAQDAGSWATAQVLELNV